MYNIVAVNKYSRYTCSCGEVLGNAYSCFVGQRSFRSWNNVLLNPVLCNELSMLVGTGINNRAILLWGAVKALVWRLDCVQIFNELQATGIRHLPFQCWTCHHAALGNVVTSGNPELNSKKDTTWASPSKLWTRDFANSLSSSVRSEACCNMTWGLRMVGICHGISGDEAIIVYPGPLFCIFTDVPKHWMVTLRKSRNTQKVFSVPKGSWNNLQWS